MLIEAFRTRTKKDRTRIWNGLDEDRRKQLVLDNSPFNQDAPYDRLEICFKASYL